MSIKEALMPLSRGTYPIAWVNTPVIVEAIQRHEQGRLPRSLALWLQSLMEIEAAPSGPRSPQG